MKYPGSNDAGIFKDMLGIFCIFKNPLAFEFTI
jgi:hypothetical protein